jgi:hypothetical protein
MNGYKNFGKCFLSRDFICYQLTALFLSIVPKK